MADLAAFVGGQAEIQSLRRKAVFRGHIETIEVHDRQLRITFAWLARGMGDPPTRWERELNQTRYAADLRLCRVTEEGEERIRLSSVVTDEMTFIYPPNGPNLIPEPAPLKIGRDDAF